MGKNKSGSAPSVILHRDLSTQQQIGMLLSVANSLQDVLLGDEREHENIPGKRSVSGDVFSAASNSFVLAMDRIDRIIRDDSRWGTDYQSALEKQYAEQHDAALAASRASTESDNERRRAAQTLTLPQFRFRPNLVRVENGDWCAYLGNPEDLDNAIVGVGKNPQAALDSFDQAFRGEISESVQRWLKQHEQNLDSGVETKIPFPNEKLDTK